MTAALAALVVGVWLLGGHLQDDLLGRAVRLWMGPGVAVALVADGLAVFAVVAVGFALLVATVAACVKHGSGRIPQNLQELVDLAEHESRVRYVRELRSTISIPPRDEERAAHG